MTIPLWAVGIFIAALLFIAFAMIEIEARYLGAKHMLRRLGHDFPPKTQQKVKP